MKCAYSQVQQISVIAQRHQEQRGTLCPYGCPDYQVTNQDQHHYMQVLRDHVWVLKILPLLHSERTLQVTERKKKKQHERVCKCYQQGQRFRYILSEEMAARSWNISSRSYSRCRAKWARNGYSGTRSCCRVGQVSACPEYAGWGVVKNCTRPKLGPLCSFGAFLLFSKTLPGVSGRSWGQVS